MPPAVRYSLIIISLIFFPIGAYHRIQSQRTGESLDRSKEGWPTMIGIRLFGLLSLGVPVLWFSRPAWFTWAALPVTDAVRWLGVADFVFAAAWLIWMFRALGRNLTDTVVVRREAYFVSHGPYRYVRNPMYTGILMASFSLGLALGTWLVPLSGIFMFSLLARRTRIEEKYLLERFGDSYRAYMHRVGRFFPRLFSVPPPPR